MITITSNEGIVFAAEKVRKTEDGVVYRVLVDGHALGNVEILRGWSRVGGAGWSVSGHPDLMGHVTSDTIKDALRRIRWNKGTAVLLEQVLARKMRRFTAALLEQVK